ncbi:MAG TPA: hypothetical protein VGW96_05190 [Candidatus Eremiobacteraceae bacterium]|nr:hypothetical protein [Candidatus Eremiobacteraceae bacterium]
MKPVIMDVVCIIGDRVYHAPGSPCHQQLEGRGTVLNLTEAQAHEVGIEPCGFCVRVSHETPKPQNG